MVEVVDFLDELHTCHYCGKFVSVRDSDIDGVVSKADGLVVSKNGHFFTVCNACFESFKNDFDKGFL